VPRLAAAFSTVSYWDTTTSRGSGESKPAMGKGKEARISRLTQTTSPPCSLLISSIAFTVFRCTMRVRLGLDTYRRGRVVVGKAGFHLADGWNEVSDQGGSYSEDA
jgi:hypothetical protein